MTFPSHYGVDKHPKDVSLTGQECYIFGDAYDGDYRLSPGPALLNVKLQLKWIPNAGFAGDIVAEKYGPRWGNVFLDLLPGEPGSDPVSSVLSGAADFGVTTGDRFVLSVADHSPLVAIAAVYQRNPLAWVSRERMPVRSPAELRDRQVGVTNVDDPHLLTALLKKGGLSDSNVRRVPVTGDDLDRLLLSELDAYPVYENTQGAELKAWAASHSEELHFLSPERFGIRAYSNIYVTTRSMIDSYPEVVNRFVGVVMAGWRLTVETPEHAADIVRARDISIGRESVQDSVISTAGFVNPGRNRFIGQMDLEKWGETEDLVRQSKQLHPHRRLKLQEHFTNDFAQRAAEMRAA